MFSKDKLVFDTTVTLSENDNIGAFLRAEDGTLITHTTVAGKQRLDVDLGVEYNRGSAAGGTDRGAFILGVDPSNNYAPLKVNASGDLLVAATLHSATDYAQGAAWTAGNIGDYVLTQRQDVLTADAGGNGHYQSFKTDSVGALWTHVSAMPIPSSTTADYGAVSVTDTATAVPATALTGRTRILIENLGNTAIFVGSDNTVTTTTGLRLAAGASIELDAGAAVTLFAIAQTGLTADVRYFELA